MSEPQCNAAGLIWLETMMPFREVAWADLAAGDPVYYTVKGRNEYNAEQLSCYGPFAVVDPARGRIRNQNGYEFDLPGKQMLKLVVEEL